MDIYSTNVDGYECLADVINEVTGIFTEDIMRHTTRLPSGIEEKLIDPPRGIYIRGMLEPLMNFDEYVYYAKEGNESTKIESLEEALKHDRIQVMSSSSVYMGISRYKEHLSDKPHLPYSMCHLVVAYVYGILKDLCRHTNVSTNRSMYRSDTRYWFKDGEGVGFTIPELEDKLFSFIGKDYQHYYSLYIKNSTMVIEKHNDFRVVEYYRPIFESLEEKRSIEYGY